MLNLKISNRKSVRAGVTGVVAATVAGLALVALPGHASATDAGIFGADVMTPGQYEDFLYTEEFNGDVEAGETLDQFQKLDAATKLEFVEYLSDPAVGEALGNFVNDVADEDNFVTETRKEIYGGDVVMEVETGVDDGVAAASTNSADSTFGTLGTAGDHSAWYSVSDTIFGVKVTWVKIGVNYNTSSTRTRKVYSGWTQHKNYVPFASFSHSPVSTWISADPGNNAHAETVWTGKWAGVTWSARERVWADQDGFKGGYLK
ncbi:hypothetical protein ACFCX0_46700 [Streptomyces sp. NPDC056352]|uniref:hypothetical protein n=1 Tax=Streptomyces sp. NPDC056352 TaxID=3345791 RepID=UPI0035E26391